MSNKCDLICKLFEIDAIKFGKFVLKSGITSPVYIDLRVIISYPRVLKDVIDLLWEKIDELASQYDVICGVPYTALPLATGIALYHNIPMVICRKETKSYGTRKLVEGNFKPNQKCLIIEDVVTSGASILEVIKTLNSVDLLVNHAIVLLDREQGGGKNLSNHGIKMYSILTLREVVNVLCENKKIKQKVVEEIVNFLALESAVKIPLHSSCHNKVLKYSERSQLCSHPLASRLFSIMESKQSNLCVALDVDNSTELLMYAEMLGPYVCMVKTHVDIMKQFEINTMKRLSDLAQKYNFFILEDRKFADIGHTVQMQFEGGCHRISSWCDAVTVHSVPGSGIIDALKKTAGNKGAFIVAQMSSSGALTTKDYASASLNIGEKHPDFVIGYISQSKLSSNPAILHLTPGVKIIDSNDDLGQQYNSPENVIKKHGADIIIVGRGILEASDSVEAAKLYKRKGFEAYLETIVS